MRPKIRSSSKPLRPHARKFPGSSSKWLFTARSNRCGVPIDQANKYIVVTSPFTLAKDPAQRGRVGAILHHLLEGLYLVAVELRPFMPETSTRLLELLGLPSDSRIEESWRWGTAYRRPYDGQVGPSSFPASKRIHPDARRRRDATRSLDPSVP
jgi:methionyl-tRNA synthetase